jgi:hypothetical protein
MLLEGVPWKQAQTHTLLALPYPPIRIQLEMHLGRKRSDQDLLGEALWISDGCLEITARRDWCRVRGRDHPMLEPSPMVSIYVTKILKPPSAPAQVDLVTTPGSPRPGRRPCPPGLALSPLCRLCSPLRLKCPRKQLLRCAPGRCRARSESRDGRVRRPGLGHHYDRPSA